jgi:hypothetical protein
VKNRRQDSTRCAGSIPRHRAAAVPVSLTMRKAITRVTGPGHRGVKFAAAGRIGTGVAQSISFAGSRLPLRNKPAPAARARRAPPAFSQLQPRAAPPPFDSAGYRLNITDIQFLRTSTRIAEAEDGFPQPRQAVSTWNKWYNSGMPIPLSVAETLPRRTNRIPQEPR